MKILLIPPNDLLRHPIPNRMYHIAKRLARRYDIILLSYTGHPLAGEVRRTLEAIEVPIGRAINVKNLGLYYLLNAPQVYLAIKGIINKEGIDIIIHANILPSFIASVLAKRYGIPNIYDFLDYFPESASVYYTKGKCIVEIGVKTFIYPALNNSDAIVTPSIGLRNVVRNIVPEKPIYVIPNGVDADLFKPMDQNIARKSIGLDSDYYLLLLQGSIDVWIDVESLLKILKKLRKTFDVRLLIVGFSHAKHYYRLLLTYAKHYGIDKYIYTYPPQPYEKMPLFINASDIIVAPIKKMIMNFATPLKIAEALACGVPVITTAIAEFKIWYKQGVYLYNNFEELEKVLALTIKNKEEVRKTLIEYSHQFRELFSWDNLANKFISIINSLTRK